MNKITTLLLLMMTCSLNANPIRQAVDENSEQDLMDALKSYENRDRLTSDINEVDPAGWTPLASAVNNKNVEIARILL